jgi:hypothetical protein
MLWCTGRMRPATMQGREIIHCLIGRLGREAPEDPSGDDAAMLAGEIGVSRDRARRREVQIALERKSQRAAGSGELEEAHVTEFGFTETEVAKSEGQIDVGVELGQEPGGVAVGGEELDDGLEVEGAMLLVEGGALGASVLEEFLALGRCDEAHGFDSCLGGPQRSVHGNSRTAQGPPGIERSSLTPDQHGSRQHRP